MDDDFAGMNIALDILFHHTYIHNLSTTVCFFLNIDLPEIYHAQTSKSDNKAKSKIEKYNIESGIFTGNYKNDGVSGEFDGLTYQHSQELLKVCELLIIFSLVQELDYYYKIIYIIITTIYI